jgi:hypothetical protein
MEKGKCAVDEEDSVVLRREIRRILSVTTVNPEPVRYWGAHEDPEGKPTVLSLLFGGRVILKTRIDGSTFATFRCDAHAAVVANPDKFSSVVDEEGICGVHACAINGYLETLKVLVEEGAASPFVQARGRLDALMLARRRGHEHIIQYLDTFSGEAGQARLAAISARVGERRVRMAAARALLDGAAGDASEEDPDLDAPEATTELEEQRTAKQAEVRSQALAASLAAIQKDAPKPTQLLPRKFWRAEFTQLDVARGIGYYPRKPVVEEE